MRNVAFIEHVLFICVAPDVKIVIIVTIQLNN